MLDDVHTARLHLTLAWHCLARNRHDLYVLHVADACALLRRALGVTVA